jgi:hypothetical protein
MSEAFIEYWMDDTGQRLDGGKCIVFEAYRKPNPEALHVIEYSAYEAIKKKLWETKIKLDRVQAQRQRLAGLRNFWKNRYGRLKKRCKFTPEDFDWALPDVSSSSFRVKLADFVNHKLRSHPKGKYEKR